MSEPQLNINARRARQGRGGLRLAIILAIVLLLAALVGIWLYLGVR